MNSRNSWRHCRMNLDRLQFYAYQNRRFKKIIDRICYIVSRQSKSSRIVMVTLSLPDEPEPLAAFECIRTEPNNDRFRSQNTRRESALLSVEMKLNHVQFTFITRSHQKNPVPPHFFQLLVALLMDAVDMFLSKM